MREHLAWVWGPREPMSEAEMMMHAEIGAEYDMNYEEPGR